MTVLVMLPVGWSVCAEDHYRLYLPSQEGVLKLDIIVASGGMNLHCDLSQDQNVPEERKEMKVTLDEMSAEER